MIAAVPRLFTKLPLPRFPFYAFGIPAKGFYSQLILPCCMFVNNPGGYSFTAPAVIPPTIYFCRKMNRQITGRTRMVPYAMMQFHLVPHLLWNL